MKNDIHDLGLVLESRTKLVVIESWDEARVLEMLTGLLIKRGLGGYVWTITEGLQPHCARDVQKPAKVLTKRSK